jgi:hypothetical protein
METSILLFCIAGCSSLVTVAIFFYHLKSVKQYGLLLWGIFLLLEVIFIGLAGIIQAIFLKNVPLEDALALVSNILLLFYVAITLLIYHKFNPLQPIVLVGSFVIFLIMWFIEFANSYSPQVELLDTTLIFSKVVIVTLVWLYLFDLYLKPHLKYTDIPFFWIAVGWLLFASISAVTCIPEIVHAANWSKDAIGSIMVIAEIISLVLYSIGFWKTKEWIIQHPNMYE